jgi:uncharacterized zinc-type alcohol dehydrogenase-like protein
MTKALAYAAFSATAPLAPYSFERRPADEEDVSIEILYCGVCHSDLHTARSEWGSAVYPCVTGHEIVGRVTAVGSAVSRFKEGDLVGVGCMVDSCRQCVNCNDGLEQYCVNGMTGTYNSPDRKGGANTLGGYSNRIVVADRFVVRIPDGMDPAAAAPLLCAGITTYSPLRHWKAGPGKKVGVVGLGGLGHMGVKLAHAMGAEVVLFTTSPEKVADGKALGASQVVISKDAAAVAAHAGSFDLIINTVAVSHDLNPYLNLLKRDGALVLVGAPEHPHKPLQVFSLLMGRRSLAGSAIGGMPETQEMLDFCAEKGLTADIEMIPIQGINEAWERMLKGDVKYRFVIDMASLQA